MIRKIFVYITQKLGIYKFAVDIETNINNRKKRKYFKKYGLEALIQADKAFKSAGSFIFLNFGTLLGAYRDKGFIPYDFDLDVGFLNDCKPENMTEVLTEHGFVHKRQFYIKDTGRITEDVYTYKGVYIDFFAYFTKGNEMYCYLGRRHESKSPGEANESDGFPTRLSWTNNEGFRESEFLGHVFTIPANTSQWLEDIYGASFMKPVKNWSEFDQRTRIEFHDERAFRRDY